jgi:hypothetical protein
MKIVVVLRGGGRCILRIDSGSSADFAAGGGAVDKLAGFLVLGTP